MQDAHRLRLHRDPSSPFHRQCVEDLFIASISLYRSSQFEQSIGQRAFAVVHVRDDAKVSRALARNRREFVRGRRSLLLQRVSRGRVRRTRRRERARSARTDDSVDEDSPEGHGATARECSRVGARRDRERRGRAAITTIGLWTHELITMVEIETRDGLM